MEKAGKIVKKAAFIIFVVFFVGIIVLPFFWQFMTSIKPLSEISAIPAKWIPSSVHGDFYVNVFTKHPFGRYLLNSFGADHNGAQYSDRRVCSLCPCQTSL